MYTSVKTRKKRRHVGPTCLKIPGENTGTVCTYVHTNIQTTHSMQTCSHAGFMVQVSSFNVFKNRCGAMSANQYLSDDESAVNPCLRTRAMFIDFIVVQLDCMLDNV